MKKGEQIKFDSEVTQLCIGCNWGAIQKQRWFGLQKEITTIDLDLCCIMFNDKGEFVDLLYSKMYEYNLLRKLGLLSINDICNNAYSHSRDDMEGDRDGNDGLDNEVISLNLKNIDISVSQIYFFLNNCGQQDFSQIPYAEIRLYKGEPNKIEKMYVKYDVTASTQYRDMTALVMGKLIKYDNVWSFEAIGEAYEKFEFDRLIEYLKKRS